MLDVARLAHIKGTITGVPVSTPEGVWVPGRGIEIPCECVLLGKGKDGDNVRQVLLEVQKSRKRKAED